MVTHAEGDFRPDSGLLRVIDFARRFAQEGNYGFACIDNGFRFDQRLRVPIFCLLMQAKDQVYDSDVRVLYVEDPGEQGDGGLLHFCEVDFYGNYHDIVGAEVSLLDAGEDMFLISPNDITSQSNENHRYLQEYFDSLKCRFMDYEGRILTG
jgi:hypothetical protein